MPDWYDLPWTLQGSRTAVQPAAPEEPRPGDLWLDSDEDLGHDVPPGGLFDLVERLTLVEAAVAGPRTVDAAPVVELTPRPDMLVDRVAWQTPIDTTITPTGGADGQVLRAAIQALGAARTVAVAASVRTSTGLAERQFPVPAGEVLIVAVERAFGVWILTAATVSG